MPPYIITTPRLGLRNWADADIEPFAEMNMDADIMRYFPATLSNTETLAFVERIKARFTTNGFGLWAVEVQETGEFIGFTGFSIPRFDSFFTHCIEIGWRLKKSAWGNGYATEAAEGCLQYGFAALGFTQVYSFTAAINTPSENVMRKIGMARIEEFDHPMLQPSSPLCRHVLYKIEKASLSNKF